MRLGGGEKSLMICLASSTLHQCDRQTGRRTDSSTRVYIELVW